MGTYGYARACLGTYGHAKYYHITTYTQKTPGQAPQGPLGALLGALRGGVSARGIAILVPVWPTLAFRPVGILHYM